MFVFLISLHSCCCHDTVVVAAVIVVVLILFRVLSYSIVVYFWVGNYYLVPLAVCRMAALVGPFLFHSYTGTAVRFPKLYQALYGMTAVLVTIHMMGLLLLNPQSLESILPLELVSSFGTSNNNNHHDTNDNPDSHNETTLLTVRSLLFQQSPLEEWHSSYQDDHAHRLLLQHLHALRRVWWMLVFSAVSTACHLAVLNHVTSTAPSWRDVHPKHHRPRQPQSVYFALRSRRKRHEQVLQRRRQRQRQAAAAAGSDPETGHEWDHPLSDDYDDDEEWDDGSDNDEEEPALVHAVNGTRYLYFKQLCHDFGRKAFSRTPSMRVYLLSWPLLFSTPFLLFFSFLSVDDVCYRILGGCARSFASCQARMVQTVG